MALRRPCTGAVNFNPRSPYGERHPCSCARVTRIRFQSTLPLRGATNCPIAVGVTNGFQSTLPLRGATGSHPLQDQALGDFNPRSPYGERPKLWITPFQARYFNPRSPYGERLAKAANSTITDLFQSTLPLRGATSFRCTFPNSVRISIHAPLTGSDTIFAGPRPKCSISIHAPLTGSDAVHRRRSSRALDFNPRSPYGERLETEDLKNESNTFQSTLPLRGATGAALHPCQRQGFQSTLPLRGATIASSRLTVYRLISIHAPLTGSDAGKFTLHRGGVDFNPRSPYGERRTQINNEFVDLKFQSTLPLRGATYICRSHVAYKFISIHAPLTGSDSASALSGGYYFISIHAPLTGSDRAG